MHGNFLFVPHDMPGLVKLYGGDKPFEAKLDEFLQNLGIQIILLGTFLVLSDNIVMEISRIMKHHFRIIL